MMAAYYNEIDKFAAEWLRNLIAAGHIAPGDVDERDIRDVQPSDLTGYTQCHFFAGIGGWSYALRLAGWPDDEPVWTGSCPCQPLSSAGQRKGHADERHLWPAFHSLISECRPSVVFGEQVASKDGREWLAAVRSDLEGDGYAIGAADLCAAGVGAPHIRQRLWWVANANGGRAGQYARKLHGDEGQHEIRQAHGDNTPLARSADGRLADSGSRGQRGDGILADGLGARLERHAGDGRDGHQPGWLDEGAPRPASASGASRSMANSERDGGRTDQPQRQAQGRAADGWARADWLPCRDGKARPVEPGTFPLAHGIPGRVGRLRAYGNAIVAPLAAEFIGAYREINAPGVLP